MNALQEAEKLLPQMSRAEKAQLLHWVVSDLSNTFPGIEVRAATSGSTAYIRQTRIPVWLVEQMSRLGVSDAQLLNNYPGLNADDLTQARMYTRSHQSEIERAIHENEE